VFEGSITYMTSEMTPLEVEASSNKLKADFLAAYDEYADQLFRHCLIRIRERDVAKDLVQETYSRAWLYLSQGKQIEYMRAFLFRVANNLIVDTARKKHSSSLDAMIENDGFEPMDEMAKNPIEIPQAREAVALLKSLDDIYRTAITMRFIEEMTPKEIAKKLGVSENVVSVRIHRGIERLSKMMNRTHPEIA
jgi:RNA polymerase sigma-70 factor (ECF subfamily)